MGWADAHHAVGTLDPEELDPGRPEVLACFGGYLYLNAAMARIFGVRAPGLTPEMVDYLYFGNAPGRPAVRARGLARERDQHRTSRRVDGPSGSWPPTSPSCATCGTRQRLGPAVPTWTKLDDAALVARARSFIPLIRRMFERHLEVTAGASIGSGVIGAVCAAWATQHWRSRSSPASATSTPRPASPCGR